MAFLNGIFNKPAATPPAAPAPGGAPAAGGSAGSVTVQNATGTGPANPSANPANMGGNPAAAPAGGPQPAGLDRFADMFKPKPVDPNAPKPVTLADPILQPIDSVAFKAQVATANFAAAVPAELMAKAVAGDASAMLEAMNIVGRESFAAATQLSHGLIDHGARTAAERVSGTLDGRIRSSLIRGQNTNNEVLTNPAVAPVFNAIKAQLAQNNPQLSPAEVQQHAEQFFTEMSSAMTAPQRQAEEANNKPKVPNFAYLLDNN